MEYIEGDNLLMLILKNKMIPEETSKRIFLTACLGLQAIHEKGLIHRDIKMENIIILNGGLGTPPCKILDFGLAHSIKKSNMKEVRPIRNCGTPGYIAPELINSGLYGFPFDIFSLGVVLYIMLTGCFPFPGKNQNEIIEKNKMCIVNYNTKRLQCISKEAKDLMGSMIKKNPHDRLTLEKVLSHSWLSGISSEVEVPIQTTKLSIMNKGGAKNSKEEVELGGSSPKPQAFRKKNAQKNFVKGEEDSGLIFKQPSCTSFHFLIGQVSSVSSLKQKKN